MADKTVDELSVEAKAEADVLFAQLETESEYEAWKYMATRVPSALQGYFLASHPDPHAAPAEAPTA